MCLYVCEQNCITETEKVASRITKWRHGNQFSMRAKIISLSIALLLGMAAWADDVWNYNVYGDCNKNGYVGIENGYQWVDLGLPSGIKWATCNVGAEKPEDYGNYYAWGETAPKTDYSWETYKYANGDYDKLTKYCNEASYGDNGFTDDKTTLESADDAATANLGEEWRMPTDAEWTELRENCIWRQTARNGVNGYLVASKTNSNSIFLPAAGYRGGTYLDNAGYIGNYWSSSLNEYNPGRAWNLYFGSDYVFRDSNYRYFGFSVRPVCQISSSDAVTLTLKANGCESANMIICNTGRQVYVSAVPENEYRHFVRWTDGNTDSPRLITVTQDTTLTAEFALIVSGQCGDNLYWQYAGHTLTISGTGDMYDYNENDVPWILFRDTTNVVVLETGITHIGNNAFNGFVKLNRTELPNTLTSIGANAFANCRRLYDIYAYPAEPPVADNTSFANYNVYLYVPCEQLRDYQLDVVWGNFKFIQCLGAENTTTGDDITVTPAGNEATFVWRADGSANTYTLEIRKDNVVFCTLVFNASGQLTSIAFAPSRNGQPRHAAEQTGDGFRFTVTGLSESTHYTFGMTVKDANNATLQTYTGEFKTTAAGTALDNVAATDAAVRKIIRDGQILILRNGKTYTTTGVEVR